MLEHSHTPPPLLHSPSSSSDRSRFPSRDTTPATPSAAGTSAPANDLPPQRSWFQKPIDVGRTTTHLCLDSSLLRPDFDEDTFPQFGVTPPAQRMAIDPHSNDIKRHTPTSTSPRQSQISDLTTALKRGDPRDHDKMNPPVAMDAARPSLVPQDSSDMTRFEKGAKPITVKGRQPSNVNRRESVANSLAMGMSWGGASVGSWIRDDMIMAGTSPFAWHQSPSYHSSSYLPKLEANFMKDFVCCGMTLPTLHDLLQHYEEAHAQKDPATADMPSQPMMPDQRAAIATNTAAQVQHEAQRRAQSEQAQGGAVQPSGQLGNANGNHSGFTSSLQTIADMDTVEDMEMDDIDGADEQTPPSNLFTQSSNHASPSGAFAAMAQPQVPQLNTNMMQSHQAYRNSTPSTPVTGRNSAAFQGANISSTLNPNPMQHFQDMQNQYRPTPDNSMPGSPAELDESLLSNMDDISLQNGMFGNMSAFGDNFGFGMANDMTALCIDEPAKRLFQTGPQNQSQAAIHQRLGSGQYSANSDVAQRIRQQQLAAGLPDTTTNLAPHEEPKPFRCPVIGCEKAYKNQNGLKYHKTHGHQNQRLHENGDGTFSIVDPDSNAPYPGTMGMEKEKPYKCDVCQKRYKNLNGLKYHKQHSVPCNPELQLQKSQQQQQSQQTPSQPQTPQFSQTLQTPVSNMMPHQNMNMNMGNFGFGNMLGNSGIS